MLAERLVELGLLRGDDERLDVVVVTEMAGATLLVLGERWWWPEARRVDPELLEPGLGLLVADALQTVDLDVDAVELDVAQPEDTRP